ncbi:cell division protein ZapE [Alterinioella nitratireducens]|uniref:cell division protein ZapE n=1 Tax=Alterinioella nitratireducens TaxID=2735915 RepID=UPI001555AEBF|nr:cell division protein ZapE [Alterinioella nitratireducens]NPD18655.1 cell division protein ZapE [Alterinioella nitratireducens]
MGQHLQAIYDTRVAEGLLRPDPGQREVLLVLEELRETLEDRPVAPPKGLLGRFFKPTIPEGIRGVYLWGGVGRGKSMLMDLFYAHAGIAEKRRVHFHAFMQEIQSGLHEARKTGVDDALKPVADAVARNLRLLCFDEMQITDITDAMIVGRLFEMLFQAGVVVVATSNRPPDDLYKDGLNRQLFLPFIELLNETLTVHEITALTDYRQDRLSGAQTYFHPADDAAKAAIDEIWTDLTGGKSEELVLEIKKREVHLPNYWAGMARIGFDDLCGRPLGPADYLALAGAVKLLVLENVPKLDKSRFNEAKRFVTLIDALYEAKTQLIISAEETPERLYDKGTGSFEFERTASRLREMQSADWAKD